VYNLAPHNPVATRCKWIIDCHVHAVGQISPSSSDEMSRRAAHFYHSRSVTSVWAAAYDCVASALSARPPLALMNVKWERWRSLWLIGTCARPRALASANLHTHHSLSLSASRWLHGCCMQWLWVCTGDVMKSRVGVWELSVCVHKTFLAEMRACTLHKVTPLLAIPGRTLSSSLCSYINMRAPVLLHVQRERDLIILLDLFSFFRGRARR
jgi:hypothetical protein